MALKLLKPLAIVFLVVYFVYLVVSRAPAELAASALHKRVPALWLTGVKGTVWSGQAASGQYDLPKSSLPLGEVKWRISFWSLLTLKPCIQFETGPSSTTASGKACQSLAGTTYLKDLSINSSVAPFSEYLAVELGGRGSVDVVTGELRFGSNNSVNVESLDARLAWQNAQANTGDSWMNLGSYAATVKENTSKGVTAQIFNLEAPVNMEMAANWTQESGWHLNGSVVMLEKAPDLLKQGIQLVGQELAPNTYQVTWP